MLSITKSDSYAELDSEELFRLGVKASHDGLDADSLHFLKMAVERDRTHAQARWLLGAGYASLGMIERARECLEAALQLEPALHTARFQWGLLELTSGQVEAAQKIWEPLDSLPESHPLRLFKRGMLELARDDMEAAQHSLRRALDDTALDVALRKDIQMVLQQMETNREAAQQPPSDPAVTATEPDEGGVENQLMLSAYQRGLH